MVYFKTVSRGPALVITELAAITTGHPILHCQQEIARVVLPTGRQLGLQDSVISVISVISSISDISVTPVSSVTSPTLKWQVIAPLQLGRKEQKGTCDFEGRLHQETRRGRPR